MTAYLFSDLQKKCCCTARIFAKIFNKHLPPENAAFAKVSDETNICLSLRPRRKNSVEKLSEFVWGRPVDMYSKILLLDPAGNIMARVGEMKTVKPVTWYRRRPREYLVMNPQETVKETIARIPQESQDDIWYVLDLEFSTLYMFLPLLS